MASARSLDVHSDKTHRVSGAKAGADVYPVGRRRGAVGAVVEPLAESLPDGGESAREGQSGDDCVLASAFGGYGSERPQGESIGLRLREMRHGLSQHLVNLAAFGWEAHGEPPAALRFSMRQRCRKSHALSKPPSPFRGKPTPVSPSRERGSADCDLYLISGDGLVRRMWIPAFAGMTGAKANFEATPVSP